MHTHIWICVCASAWVHVMCVCVCWVCIYMWCKSVPGLYLYMYSVPMHVFIHMYECVVCICECAWVCVMCTRVCCGSCQQHGETPKPLCTPTPGPHSDSSHHAHWSQIIKPPPPNLSSTPGKGKFGHFFNRLCQLKKNNNKTGEAELPGNVTCRWNTKRKRPKPKPTRPS